MVISEKDREQLLIMAGNIACGLVGYTAEETVPKLAAKFALETMQEVDRLMELYNVPKTPEQDAPTESPNHDEWELNGVMGKWSDLPGYCWITCDIDGEIWSFSEEPHHHKIGNLWDSARSSEANLICKSQAISNDSWKTMILKRPEGV